MATSLLFKKTPTTLDTVTLDAVLSEKHAESADATQHPVEVGIKLTDHVRQKPAQLQLQVTVSDTPLPITGPTSAQAGRSVDAYAQVLRLKESGTLLTVSSRPKRYENMLITNVSLPIDKDTGEGLTFTVDLLEIRQVSSQTVAIERTSSTKARSKKDLGKKQGKDADDATKRKSLLLSGGEKVVGKAKDLWAQFTGG